MPRRPRLAAGDLAYHVLNRRVGRLVLFEKPTDYAAFEKILAEAHAQSKIRGQEKGSGVFFRCRRDDSPLKTPMGRGMRTTEDLLNTAADRPGQ